MLNHLEFYLGQENYVTKKITVQLTIDVFTYQDADEEIPDYLCYDTLAEFKANMFLRLANAHNQIQDMTMKDIKKGVTL